MSKKNIALIVLHINVSESTADLSLESQVLVDNFSTDEALSNSKYLDQIIEVTGPVAKITQKDNKTIVSLGKGGLFGNVTCHFLPEESSKLTTLKKGQEITIKGICTGYLLDVILVKSVLIK